MTLSILLWLPLAISLVVSFLPERAVGKATAAASFITLGIAISYPGPLQQLGISGLQFVTDKVWISSLGIHYKLGDRRLNVALIVLTALLFTVSLVWSAWREVDRPRLYYFYFGLAESAVLGAFLAQDLILFVGFFDLMLIPFYFLVGSWGSGDRVRATTKLVIYTAVGSFLMLAAAIATGVIAASEHRTATTFVISQPAASPALAQLAGMDVPLLRRRVPGEDAARTAARLAGRRVQVDADPGRGRVLRRALQGRRVRLHARSCCRCSRRRASTTRR